MRRLQALSYVLCTVAMASLASGDAFTVTSDPVQPSTAPMDPHGVLEQRYTITQPFVDSFINHATLSKLTIALPGRVFVSYNHDRPSSMQAWTTSPVATIRFSGNAEAMFKYFEVVSTDSHSVEVRRRASERGSLEDAYLLTEISLSQSHAISEITTSDMGDVVVEDQVLVVNGPSVLSLKHSGSGDLYVDSKSASALVSAHVSSRGSGTVFWTGGAVQIESLKLELAGSGGVTMQSHTLTTTAVQIDVAGSGHICVDAAGDMKTSTLFSSLAGSGTISFSSPSGHCMREDLTILGSGEFYLGALQCGDVKVTVAGSGGAIVQATESITGSAYGSGEVRYVGATPKRISDRHDANVFSLEQSKKYHPIAKFTENNKHMTCTTPAVPLRSAVLVRGSFWTGRMENPSVVLGVLVFLAVVSLCYLRSQVKLSRRRPRQRVPRHQSYRPSDHELQPLQPPAYQQPQYQQPQYQQPYYQQQQQQQQQAPSNQVYV